MFKETAKPQDVVYGHLCPSHFYDVFNRCLQTDPDKRPSFSEVRRALIAQVRLLVNIERVYRYVTEHPTPSPTRFFTLDPCTKKRHTARESQGVTGEMWTPTFSVRKRLEYKSL